MLPNGWMRGYSVRREIRTDHCHSYLYDRRICLGG